MRQPPRQCMTVCYIRYTHGSVLSDRPTRPWPHRRPARLLHGLGSPHALGRHLHRALPARPSPPPAPRAHPPTHSAYTQHGRYRAQPSPAQPDPAWTCHGATAPTVSCHGRSQLCSCRHPPPPRPAGRPASAHRCCGGLGDRAARARARARGRRPPPLSPAQPFHAPPGGSPRAHGWCAQPRSSSPLAGAPARRRDPRRDVPSS
jgi:hypothetical protein